MRTSFRVCPRLIYFRYIAGIQKKDDRTARFIGKTFHEGLESYRKTQDLELSLKLIKTKFDEIENLEDPDMDIFKIESYLMGYIKRFSDDFAHEIETEKELKLEDEVCYVDAVIKETDGSVSFIEDKTTSIFANQEDLEASLRIDEQILNYFDLAKQNFLELSQIKYRQTKKSVHKVAKKELFCEFKARILSLYMNEQDDRYREFIILPDDETIKRYSHQKYVLHDIIDSTVDEYRDARFSDWPWNGMSCIGKFGACDYLGICSGSCVFFHQQFEPNGKSPLDGGDFIYNHAIDNIGDQI
jgi:hypothetical protein